MAAVRVHGKLINSPPGAEVGDQIRVKPFTAALALPDFRAYCLARESCGMSGIENRYACFVSGLALSGADVGPNDRGVQKSFFQRSASAALPH